MKPATAPERDEYTEKLRAEIKPGDTLYTVLRHRAPSGMSRAIDVYKIDQDQPFRLTFWVAMATRTPYSERYEALNVSGTGMDMGYHVVYGLARTLFPGGFDCPGKGCPSNDHSNGDRDYSPHHHRDGGYALHHRWL